MEVGESTRDLHDDETAVMGWNISTDLDSGKSYFYNAKTGESRWDRPDDFGDSKSLTMLSTNLTGVPSGWSSATDVASGKSFYYNTATGETRWDRPDDISNNPTIKTNANAEWNTGTDSATGKLFYYHAATGDSRWDKPDDFPANTTTAVVEIAPSTMPAGWKTSTDLVSGRIFHYNSSTGESRWERPDVVCNRPSSTTTATSTNLTLEKKSFSNEWSEAMDPATGKLYYYCLESGETEWLPPSNESKIKHTVTSVNVQSLPSGWHVTKDSATGKLYYYHSSGLTSWTRPESVDNSSNSTTSKKEGKLPGGWHESTDPATGKIYYYHTNSGMTSWDPPHNSKVIPLSGKRKALLIGINYFGQKGELRGCINDVKNIRAALESEYYFDEMKILTDDQSDPKSIPTKASILSAFRWLSTGAKAGDSLILHYSGHGGSVIDTSGDEEDGRDETLIPVDYRDAGYILDDEIFEVLCKALPKGVRLSAIIDCCHSATMLDLPFTYRSNDDRSIIEQKNTTKNISRGFLKQQSNTDEMSVADIIMFSGCKDSQTSADAVIDGTTTGAMSYALIRALKENRNISYVNLLIRMRQILSGKYAQIPMLSTSMKLDLNTPIKL